MADYALFAEFLVNKAKLKPLSKGGSSEDRTKKLTFKLDDDYVVATTATAVTAVTATAATATAVPSTVDRGFRNNDETPQTIHQIFDGCVQRCSSVQRNQDMFREFLTNELPPLFAKFEKLCRGKHD